MFNTKKAKYNTILKVLSFIHILDAYNIYLTSLQMAFKLCVVTNFLCNLY